MKPSNRYHDEDDFSKEDDLKPRAARAARRADLYEPLRRGRAADGHDRRKTWQLCKQAQRALLYALGGECADPLLQTLLVLDVLPAPDSKHLLALVRLPASGGDAAAVSERLESVKGLLRNAVAAAITRRRAPELRFQLVPPDAPA